MNQFRLFNLNYADNLIENYQRLAKLPGFILLESSDKVGGRYDILSAFPYEQLKIEQDSSCVSQLFEQLQQCIPWVNSELDLPFQGGAIGYFSYDLAAKLAGIDSIPQENMLGMPLLHIGLYDWALITDHQLKKVTLFAANTRAETMEIVDEVLVYWHYASKNTDFTLTKPFAPLITQAEYRDAFDAIYQDLRRGRAYQVNYTQPFNANYCGDAWTMYKQIRANNKVPYSAFLHFAEGDILSFSPERFLLMEQRKLLTSPIKGTAKRSADPQQDQLLRESLLASNKNQAENVMIVDLLRNDLAKIATAGSVQVRALCSLESYQAVHHLVSHIEASCVDNKSPVDVFRTCFPGGSITGAPKLEAMHIIGEQEKYARGVYCGSIGYFSRHGRFDSNITIRTVVARNETLHMAAGGGILIDSNWEEEYVECFTKIAAIVTGLR